LTITLFASLSWIFRSEGKRSWIVLPLTAMALSIHRDFNVYATSGLETSMFTFFASAGFASLLLFSSRRSLISSGLILAILLMIRPDGIIFLSGGVLYLFLIKKDRFKTIFIFLIPTLTIFLPYWMWRYHYYGYFFPNTYYAKSINLTYYNQGIIYAKMFFTTYYVFTLIIFLGILAFGPKLYKIVSKNSFHKIKRHLALEPDKAHPILFGFILIVGQTLFVTRIGGDFMFARLFIPIVPILYFTMECLLKITFENRTYIILAAIVLIATFFRFDQFKITNGIEGVCDEKQLYTQEHLQKMQREGIMLRKYFAGLPVSVVFWGTQARLMYYAEPAVAIEGTTGLTDTYIAHQPLSSRGSPGHEKRVPRSYLHTRHVNFTFDDDTTGFIDVIFFGNIRGRIIAYNNEVMSKLAAYPEIKFVKIPEFIDSYITAMKSFPREKILRDYRNLKSFYFNHNQDPVRENAFIQHIQLATQ
jgi:arabinofuranosyltransferase